jgi:hypothetical protein
VYARLTPIPHTSFVVESYASLSLMPFCGQTILAGAGFLADAYDLFVINIGKWFVS